MHGHAELFGRPLGRPLRRHDLVEGMVSTIRSRKYLVHCLDHEAGAAQHPHPVPVRGMKLDPASGPVHLVGLTLTAHQMFPRDAFRGRGAQCRQVAVGEEDVPSRARLLRPGAGRRRPRERRPPSSGAVRLLRVGDHHDDVAIPPVRGRRPGRTAYPALVVGRSRERDRSDAGWLTWGSDQLDPQVRLPRPVVQARGAKAWESKISGTPGTGWSKSMAGGNRVLSSCLNATSNGLVEAARVRFASNGSVPSM